MPRLEGRLTRKQRIEIAKDVIALCKSRQRKIKIKTGAYLSAVDDFDDPEGLLLSEGGQLTSRRLPACQVCARGALFVASVDRHDRCDLGGIDSLSDAVQVRSEEDWGKYQVSDIEGAFEGWYGGRDLPREPKARLIAIMENIVANNGEYKRPGS